MTSSLPPPPSSWRGFVRRSAAWARLVAALLVTMTATRFAIASFQHLLEAGAASFPGARREPSPSPAPARSVAPTVPVAAPKPVPAAPSAAPPGRSVRLNLGVSYGPPRSEVYVNGKLVGQTPFLGDMACKYGLPIRIQIVPDTAAPLTYERECLGGTVEIETPPP